MKRIKSSRMSRRTFTTKDAKGCEFKVEAFYNGDETKYYGMNLKANSLIELKKLVAAK